MPSLIDPGIALRVQPPKLMTPAEAISLKQLAQQGQVQQMDLQERQRKQQEQVALRDIASQPGAMDKTGYTEDALVKIAQINPQLAVQARQQQQEAMNKAFAAQAQKVGLSMKQNDQLQESLTGHLAQYQEMAKKLPPDQAKADFAQNWNKYLDDAAPTGMYTPEQIAGMRQIKSPDDALKVVGGTKFYKDMMSVQNQEKSQVRAEENSARADERLGIAQRNSDLSAQRTAAALNHLARASGDKPPAGYQWGAKDPETGRPTLSKIKGGPADKADGFGGANGELLAALAEKGVSLPAGFRSKDQQIGMLTKLIERNPNLTVDEIADKVKSGSLDLNALRAEGRTAGNIAGKISYAENELQQTIPLVREASRRLPRGEFVPFNKLQQMGQEAFSNPDLAEYKMYMTTLSNAYDMLAARGGTDMEKRREGRRNFETAKSPEALEAVLRAVQNEAKASGQAARESIRTATGAPRPASENAPAQRKPLSSFGN